MPPRKQPPRKRPPTKASTSKPKPDQPPAKSFVIESSQAKKYKHIKVLLVGSSKSGRTHFASTFPNPLLLNADKGLQNVGADFPVIDIDRGMHTQTVLNDILGRLYAGTLFDGTDFAKYEVKTIIWDTITALSYLLEDEVRTFPYDNKDRNDGLFVCDYNVIQTRLTRLVERYREYPAHFIVISGTSREQDENAGAIACFPSVTGRAMSPRIPELFNEVYRCQFDPKTNEWDITWLPTRDYPYLGSKCPRLIALKDKRIVNPTYPKISKYFN